MILSSDADNISEMVGGYMEHHTTIKLNNIFNFPDTSDKYVWAITILDFKSALFWTYLGASFSSTDV